MSKVPEPKSLQEAVIQFSDEFRCIEYMAAKRWPNGIVVCPTCGGTKVGFLAKQKRFQCSTRHPKRQFSIKVGTIFEDSPIGLDKWLPVVWLITNAKNGISSWEVSRAIVVTQKTAWFMLHRVRLAMQDELTGGNLSGEVEIDETYIGGKARNMHKERKRRYQKEGKNIGGKTAVLGMLQRNGKIVASVIPDRSKGSIQPLVRGSVEQGAELHTDEHGDNWRMDGEYVHKIVNHLERYVDGNIHTNGLENFWSLLKRGINGTYVAVEPYHLFRYVDEQAFRFNNRGPMDDSQRFSYVMRKIVGKRLTYAELTGKEGETSPAPEVF